MAAPTAIDRLAIDHVKRFVPAEIGDSFQRHIAGGDGYTLFVDKLKAVKFPTV